MSNAKQQLVELLREFKANNFTMKELQEVAKKNDVKISTGWASEVLKQEGYVFDKHHKVYVYAKIKETNPSDELKELQIKYEAAEATVEALLLGKRDADEALITANQLLSDKIKQIETLQDSLQRLTKEKEELEVKNENLTITVNELQKSSDKLAEDSEKLLARYKNNINILEVNQETTEGLAEKVKSLQEGLLLMHKKITGCKLCSDCKKAEKCSEYNLLFNKPCEFVIKARDEVNKLCRKLELIK